MCMPVIMSLAWYEQLFTLPKNELAQETIRYVLIYSSNDFFKINVASALLRYIY